MGGSVRVSSGIKKYEKRKKEDEKRQHDSPCGSVTVIDLCVRFQPAAFAQILQPLLLDDFVLRF